MASGQGEEQKKEVIQEAQKEQKNSPFCYADGHRSSQESGVGTKVLEVFWAGCASGSYAVLTEQGSSASQMTAATVMDVIARLPDCVGQAADAESAYTQVKNGRHSDIVDTSGQNRGQTLKIQWFLSNEFIWTPIGGTLLGETV